MSSYSFHTKEENKDKIKSGIITAVIWSVLLLFVFMYKITERIPEKKEVVTKMIINFGDNRNGNGIEEPANQEGSLASEATTNVDEISAPKTETKISAIPEPSISKPAKSEVVKEKVITGNSEKHSTKVSEKTEKKEKTSNATTAPSKTTASSSPSKNTGSKATTANSTTGNGDGKGTAAIGNLIKGRGTKTGTQGNNGTIGNEGDPLGGDGNGDSKIGVDRKLVGFIPGTMGRGGAQPAHNCSASGTINIAYTVDKAGNVISARRSGGISDQCVAATSVEWVKRYVKAEKANTFSTGTYRITF